MLRLFPAFAVKLFQDLRSSYWFVPSFMTLLALAAAIGSERIDAAFASDWLPSILRVTDPDAARTVLGGIASASIGSAGVLFSMTMVAVSFASSNFGPRLIGNFMQDRGVQFSLGAMLSTFVYATAILLSVKTTDDSDFVPALSLTVAMALMFLSVGVMIYFIHHIPEIISLENVTARLGRRLMDAVRALPDTDWPEFPDTGFDGNVVPLRAEYPGYVQALDAFKMCRIATENRWGLRLLKGPGDFLMPGTVIAEIAAPAGVSEEDLRTVRACVAVGDGRTETQNALFLAQQMQEMIARALSPGINDPVSAIDCLNWLHAALHLLAGSKDATAMATHPGALSFTAVLHVAHRDTRPYVASDPLTARHALHRLDDLLDVLPPGPRRDAVTEERQKLMDAALALSPRNAELQEIAAAS